MYTYESAVSVTMTSRPETVLDDISDIPLKQIFRTYYSNKVILSTPYYPQKLCMLLQDLQSELANSELTLNAWLASIGNRGLPTTTELPNTERRYAKYYDMQYLQWELKPTKITAHPDREFDLHDATDLLMIRGDADYDKFYRSSLVTINGFIHRTDKSDDGIYVLNGVESALIAQDTHVGCINFNKVSNLSFYNVDLNTLQPATESAPYRDVMRFDNLSFETENKTIALVIGGVLYMHDNVLQITGNKSAQLSTVGIDWVDRYYVGREFINLNSLPITNDPNDPYHHFTSEIFGDDTLKAWLALSQSFWIVFDNPSIEVDFKVLERRKHWPGVYLTETDVRYPLLLNNGVISEYLFLRGKEKHRLNVIHHVKRTGIYKKYQHKDEPQVHDYALMSDPWVIPEGSYLFISAL